MPLGLHHLVCALLLHPSVSSMPILGLPGQTVHRTFFHGGVERDFWLHEPLCAAQSTGRPLVLMLHGWGERAAQYAGVERVSWWRAGADRWVEEAQRACFVVAWPQGLLTRLRPRMWLTSWNAGGCSSAGEELCDYSEVVRNNGGSLCSDASCGTCAACAWCSCADDLGFVVALTRALLSSEALRVDRRRVYAAGCSNGGMLTYDLATRGPPGLFAAFTVNCGLPHRGHACVPLHGAPALLHIHAPNDRTIPPDGQPAAKGGWRYETAEVALAALQAAGDGDGRRCTAPSSASGQPEWRWLRALAAVGGGHAEGGGSGGLAEAGGATGGPVSPDPADPLGWLQGVSFGRHNPISVSADGRCRLLAACSNGAQVVQCTGSFGHDWPAWAAAVAWRFFEQHTQRAPTTARLNASLGGDGAHGPEDAISAGEQGSHRTYPVAALSVTACPLWSSAFDADTSSSALNGSELPTVLIDDLTMQPSPAPENTTSASPPPPLAPEDLMSASPPPSPAADEADSGASPRQVQRPQSADGPLRDDVMTIPVAAVMALAILGMAVCLAVSRCHQKRRSLRRWSPHVAELALREFELEHADADFGGIDGLEVDDAHSATPTSKRNPTPITSRGAVADASASFHELNDAARQAAIQPRALGETQT